MGRKTTHRRHPLRHDGKKMLWPERFFDITPTTFTQTADSGEAATP
jgi:hypothetical protein